MNGAHDLGGMHGFGPVNPEPEVEEPVFHSAWEKRAFGLTLAAGFLGKWTIDMSRYSRERQHPVDYLRHTYYENWLAGLETLLVETRPVRYISRFLWSDRRSSETTRPRRRSCLPTDDGSYTG